MVTSQNIPNTENEKISESRVNCLNAVPFCPIEALRYTLFPDLQLSRISVKQFQLSFYLYLYKPNNYSFYFNQYNNVQSQQHKSVNVSASPGTFHSNSSQGNEEAQKEVLKACDTYLLNEGTIECFGVVSTDHEQKHLGGWLLKKNLYSLLFFSITPTYFVILNLVFQIIPGTSSGQAMLLFIYLVFFFTFVKRNPSVSQWKNNIQVQITRQLYLPWMSVWTLFVSFLFFLSLRKCILKESR